MKLGPDGSFFRITNSVKNYITGLKIIKTNDDQLKESKPFYKLVFENTADESSSEKSDGEMFDEEIIQPENLYKSKESDKMHEQCDVNKPENTTVQEQDAGYQNFFHRNRNNFFERKNPSRTPNTYPFNPKDEKNYKSAKRRSATSNSSYSKDINPWIVDPSIALSQNVNFAYSSYAYTNAIQEPARQVPLTSPPENHGKRMGLLGDKPIASGITNFQLNSHYVQNEASRFPPPTLNFPANDLNYWNNSYDSNYSNYQMPVPDAQMPVQSNRNDYFQPKRKWVNKKRQQKKGWKRNPKSSNVKRNQANQFKYGK